MTEQLLPCPFCGSTNTDAEGWTAHDINGGVSQGPTCDDCDAAAASVDAWNRRTPAPEGEAVTVWYGKMPESNGRENWTASLRRVNSTDPWGQEFCFARSEYPDRVRYEADRVRWIIGELPERPDILAYDADKHSGYVPPASPVVPVGVSREVPVPRDQLETLRRSLSLKSLLPGEGEALITCWLNAAALRPTERAESKA